MVTKSHYYQKYIFSGNFNIIMFLFLNIDRSLKKHWRSVHKGPVAKLAISSDSSRLVTGGSDSSVRIWDLQHNSCIQKLTDINGVCR